MWDDGRGGRWSRWRLSGSCGWAWRSAARPVSHPPARPCRAQRTARCSRPTTSGTPPSRTCPSTRTARNGWPAWTPRRPISTLTSGPPVIPPTPTASPTPWCRRHNHWCRHVRVRGPERPRALSVRRRHADRGRSAVHRRPPRHHGQPGHLHPLRAVRRAVQPVGLDGGLGGDLEPRLQRPAPGRVDIGRRGGTSNPARSRALRRGAVGRHHSRHPDDGRDDGHVVHLAGPPRGGVGLDPDLPPMGARFRLKADFDISGYSPRPRWCCAPCSSTG